MLVGYSVDGASYFVVRQFVSNFRVPMPLSKKTFLLLNARAIAYTLPMPPIFFIFNYQGLDMAASSFFFPTIPA